MPVLSTPGEPRIRQPAQKLSTLPAESRHKLSVLDRLCRRLVLARLGRLSAGRLTIDEGTYRQTFGPERSPSASLTVCRPRFWRAVVLGGSLGAAEAYLRGDWQTDTLLELLRLFAGSDPAVSRIDRSFAVLTKPYHFAAHWLRRNTRAGSRRNIADHYDLSNDFFRLMLDPTMTYSCGVFASSESTLGEASLAKYERICRKLALQPTDHVLEIGCGWGGFAAYAASRYGCRVTGTTISCAQYDHACRAIERAGVSHRVTLRKNDYRDLAGQYDKLVSIEMIEAVGERFLDIYFGQCSRLLKPNGAMLLQAILMPDHRYDRYRRGVDFIQRYVFPGGFLPSVSAIAASLRRSSDLELVDCRRFDAHYAETLSRWRENFHRHLCDVRRMGFDERFVRTWDYYLAYCEAGFRELQVGVAQFLLTKPHCRISRDGPIH